MGEEKELKDNVWPMVLQAKEQARRACAAKSSQQGEHAADNLLFVESDIQAMETTLQGIDASPQESKEMLREVRNHLAGKLEEAKTARRAAQAQAPPQASS